MKVGTVGASLETNPTVRINHRLLGSPGAVELAQVMGAVGLAQNYAALRALSTSGIQQNHMTLHARSVASVAGVPEKDFEAVVEALIECGEIKVWKAKEIAKRLRCRAAPAATLGNEPRSSACGKAILLGEHAVVHGRAALAAPIPLAVEARIVDARDGAELLIPRWGIEQRVPPVAERPQGVAGVLAALLQRLRLADRGMKIEVFPHLPRAMGLGGSAALAVAVLRALNAHYRLGLTDDAVNRYAFACEQAAHGTASGVDNAVAVYGAPLLYRNAEAPTFERIMAARPAQMVAGISGKESLTARTVAQVRAAWERQPSRYEAMFDQIESLTLAGADALRDGALEDLGELMNLCHGYLNALQLSTPELEAMIHAARTHGALGAKLTGGGGGGAMIALCPDDPERICNAIRKAGFTAFAFEVS